MGNGIEHVEKVVELTKTNWDKRYEFGNVGACEAVTKVLRAWGKTSREVAKWGCGAVGTLSIFIVTNVTTLAESGACEGVVECLREWGKTDIDVAWWGCYAVAHLAMDDNGVKFGTLGACELVVDCWRAWGKSDEDWAWVGCHAVENLSAGAINRTKLGKLGVCELVVDCLRMWGKTNVTVARSGCDAIGNLAFDNDTKKRKLQRLGAIAVVQEALENESRDHALTW